MYMLESFIPTICELEIDDEERKEFLLELAQSDDKDFKQTLKDHLEDLNPRYANQVLKSIKSTQM